MSTSIESMVAGLLAQLAGNGVKLTPAQTAEFQKRAAALAPTPTAPNTAWRIVASPAAYINEGKAETYSPEIIVEKYYNGTGKAVPRARNYRLNEAQLAFFLATANQSAMCKAMQDAQATLATDAGKATTLAKAQTLKAKYAAQDAERKGKGKIATVAPVVNGEDPAHAALIAGMLAKLATANDSGE